MTTALYDTAAELSATAADLAAAIDTGEAAEALACRAADLLADLNAGLGIGFPQTDPADLARIARQLDHDLRANRREAITDANQLDVQALCVAEEAGELVGAYRRWAGKARRTGTLRELEDEIADVLIVTACFAERAGIDLNEAIARKLTAIYTRGWREAAPAAAGQPVPYVLTSKALAALAEDDADESQQRREQEADESWGETVTAWEAVNDADRRAGGAA